MFRRCSRFIVLAMLPIVSPAGPTSVRASAASLAPLNAEATELAAIVYAEAQANPIAFNEMLAIASVVRNRVEHVAVHPADTRWFGGPGYHGVMSNRIQFPSYGSPRYRNYMRGTISSGVEQVVAQQATRAASQVYTGGSVYSYMFFQKAAIRPSMRAANPPTRLGAHHFWNFRPQCVNPLYPCR